MGYKENLKLNLEHLMKRSNITNDVLAEKTGISRSSINRIRMNKGNPTVETLLTLCDFFNVSLEEITEDVSRPIEHRYLYTDPKNNFLFNSKEIPLLDWDTLHLLKNNNEIFFYAIKSPQEYLNIPKGAILIIEKNRIPSHGDSIIVMDKNLGKISVVEYIKDIMFEYVKSILPQTLHQEVALVPLDALQIMGVVLEARKIFIPNT